MTEEETKITEEETKVNEEETKINEEETKINEEETKINEEETKTEESEISINENICQPKKSSGGSLCIKFIASAAFIFACISLVVSFINTRGLSRQISSLDSKIWSLGLRTDKIDNEVRSFSNNVAALGNNVTLLEGKMTDFEKTIVVAELKRVFSTVQDISRRSSDRVRGYANIIEKNITGLIHDLEQEITGVTRHDTETLSIPMEKPVNANKSSSFGDIHIESGGHSHSK